MKNKLHKATLAKRATVVDLEDCVCIVDCGLEVLEQLRSVNHCRTQVWAGGLACPVKIY
jgi:hypothetical protein